MVIVHAGPTDLEWLLRNDEHVGEEWISRCISLGEYLLARRSDDILGFLRFSLFWGRIPYMEMIRVLPEHQRSGVGTALFSAWEEAMRLQGAHLIMTSSESGETEPLDWHRRNGFSEAGAIALPGIQSMPETFLIKRIA